MSTLNLICECCQCGWIGIEDQQIKVKDPKYPRLGVYHLVCPKCNNASFYHTRKPQDYKPFSLERFYEMEREKGNDYVNQVLDTALVEYTTDAITNKLKKARKKGNKNWWKSSECSIEKLKASLDEHIANGQFLDVSIFAAMIHARECAEWLEKSQTDVRELKGVISHES